MADPFIRVRGLEQKFGTQHVLRGVDLDIYRAETLVLLGGSGGGKSVLLKHLPGLLSPWKGSVEVDGVDISQLNERQLNPFRKKVGIMFQGGALFDSMTVGENVAFPLREGGMKDEKKIADLVAEALEIVRLPGQEKKMPSALSGGMRKRVALARAVVDRPACVLYDEPHAGLDPVTADSIDHLIKDLQQTYQMTNVVVTHEMRSVFHIADRIIFLQEGRIHWCGSRDELKNTQDPLLRNFIEGDSGEPWS
jgi:phospholipid/cholesterol/gamma-HCH transport system ATP-binding protein